MPGRLGIWQETNAGVNIETYFSQIRNYFGQSVHDQLVSMFLNASTYYVDSLNANEWHIYGSSRLGVYQRQINMASIRFQAGVSSGQFQSPTDSTFNYAEADYSFHPIYRGHKNYELSNHLGNVLAVISDMKLYTCHQYNKFEDFENTPNINCDWNIRDSWEGQNAVIDLSNGKLHIVDSITSNPHVRVNYLLTKHLPPNQTYRIKFDLEHINGDHDWQIGIVSGNTDSTYEANFTFFSGSSGHNEITFQPTGHVWRIRFLHIPTAQDMEYNLDNFSLENLSIDSNLVAMADVLSATDYSPFGAPLAGRTYPASEYRFRFNGKENDSETYGDGNALDFGARIYDSRLGRWMSVDPLYQKYPYHSHYCFAGNSPVLYLDPDGRVIIKGTSITQDRYDAMIESLKAKDIKTYTYFQNLRYNSDMRKYVSMDENGVKDEGYDEGFEVLIVIDQTDLDGKKAIDEINFPIKTISNNSHLNGTMKANKDFGTYIGVSGENNNMAWFMNPECGEDATNPENMWMAEINFSTMQNPLSGVLYSISPINNNNPNEPIGHFSIMLDDYLGSSNSDAKTLNHEFGHVLGYVLSPLNTFYYDKIEGNPEYGHENGNLEKGRGANDGGKYANENESKF